MNSVFKTVLSLSLSGSLLILLLLLGKAFLKNRTSRRWQYYIWLVAIARLLLPFTPEASVAGTLFQQAEQAAASAKLNQPPPQERMQTLCPGRPPGLPKAPSRTGAAICLLIPHCPSGALAQRQPNTFGWPGSVRQRFC